MASMVRSPMSPALARTNSSRDFIQYEAIIEKVIDQRTYLMSSESYSYGGAIFRVHPALDSEFLLRRTKPSAPWLLRKSSLI
jgi:hypothetical protein